MSLCWCSSLIVSATAFAALHDGMSPHCSCLITFTSTLQSEKIFIPVNILFSCIAPPMITMSFRTSVVPERHHAVLHCVPSPSSLDLYCHIRSLPSLLSRTYPMRHLPRLPSVLLSGCICLLRCALVVLPGFLSSNVALLVPVVGL
jgi:hypothetical protein